MERLRDQSVTITHDYAEIPGAIPLPATLSMKIGENLGKSESGNHAHLYSPYPFPWRAEAGGLSDEFAQQAWNELSRNPEQPYFRFTEHDGGKSLRYATADLMRASCVDCHNHHPDSPKRDWKEGDMRGVLEVTLPLDPIIAQTHDELMRAIWMLTVPGMLGLLSLVLGIRGLHRTAALAARHVVDLKQEIRERQAAEQAREESERMLGAVIEADADAILTIDDSGVIRTFNTAAESIFGYLADEAIGMDINRLIPDTTWEQVGEGLPQPLDAESTPVWAEPGERTAHRRDGTEFPIDLSITAVQQENRHLFAVIVRDISDRKRAEDELRRNETRYRQLVEATRVIPWVADIVLRRVTYITGTDQIAVVRELDLHRASRRFTYMAPQVEDLLGYPPEAWYTEDFWSDHIHPDDRDAALNFYLETNQRGEDHDFEYRMIAASGMAVWIRDFVTVISENEEPVSLRGVMIDITDRKEAEERIRHLAGGIESAGESIIMTDPEGVITFVNPAFTRLTGYTPEEALGQNPRILNSGQTPRNFYKNMWKNILTGTIWSGELVNRKKDGSLYDTRLTIAPVVDDAGAIEGFIAVHSDLTDIHRAQNLLEQANRKLEEKNTELEQFVYTASHDLKSPLITIQGFLGHLRCDMAENRLDRLPGFVQRIEDASGRMRENIEDLLELSRVGRVSDEPAPVDLGAVIRELLDEYEVRIEELGVEIISPPDLPVIMADRDRILQVFDNLLVNAFKYGCSGPDPVIHIGFQITEDKVIFSVSDNGPGVPEEYREKIFRIFERLSRNAEGTGIGLAIVDKIVKSMRGRVWVESSPTGGAVFRLSFPAAIVVSSPAVSI